MKFATGNKLNRTCKPVAYLFAFVWLTIGVTGCAFIHSTTSRTTNKDGSVTEQTVATGYSLFDANNSLAKFRNQSGPSSPTNYAAGTYVSQLNETSSTTNVVNILNALGNLAGQAAAAAAK